MSFRDRPSLASLLVVTFLITGCSSGPAPVAVEAEPQPLQQPKPANSTGVAWIGPSFAPRNESVAQAEPSPAAKPQATSSAPPMAKAPAPVVITAADVKTVEPKHAVSDPAHAPAKVAAPDPHAAATGRTSAESLALLFAGNARYVAGKLEHPGQSIERRSEVAKGQHPYAIILSCADSRVPPEIIFDAGLGDLFVVRVAGNTADDAAIGSIEYAVEHLGATLIVVLGHERCGAVKAAVDTADSKTPAPGHLPAVLAPIAPAVKQVQHEHGDNKGDTADLVVRANVARVVEQLKTSDPVLSDRVKAGKLQVIGGRYDLDSGYAEIK